MKNALIELRFADCHDVYCPIRGDSPVNFLRLSNNSKTIFLDIEFVKDDVIQCQRYVLGANGLEIFQRLTNMKLKADEEITLVYDKELKSTAYYGKIVAESGYQTLVYSFFDDNLAVEDLKLQIRINKKDRKRLNDFLRIFELNNKEQ